MTIVNITTPDMRLRAIVQQYIDPVMKQHLFKKRGQKYVLDTDIFSFRFDIQRSRYNTQNDIRFTINLEIYLCEKITKSLPFVFLAPVLANRIAIMTGGGDFWGILDDQDINVEQKDSMIGEKFKMILSQYSIPFVMHVKDLNDVINVLKQTDICWSQPSSGSQTKEWMAVLYYAMGQKEKSLEMFDQAIQETRFPEGKKDLEDFKAQIFSDLPPEAA